MCRPFKILKQLRIRETDTKILMYVYIFINLFFWSFEQMKELKQICKIDFSPIKTANCAKWLRIRLPQLNSWYQAYFAFYD